MGVKKILSQLVYVVVAIFSRITPRSREKWVYIAGNGDRFAENSKYLYLNNIEAEEETEHIWIGTTKDLVGELRSNNLRAYYTGSIIGKYHLLTAGVAIETHGPQFGQFLAGATIIDTHHGNTLKMMGYDELEAGSQGWLDSIKRWIGDYLVGISYFQVTNDGTPKEIYKKARKLNDSEILVAPYPRLDPFFEYNDLFELGVNTDQLKEFQSKSKRMNIVLYAPTWREAFDKRNGSPLSDVMPDFEEIDRLMAQTGSVMYITTHPREPIDLEFEEFENIFTFDTGGDIYPFLGCCDVLVTDYSSIFYDFLFADQPICFYAPDLIEYQSSRGLYFEYAEHVPGPVSNSTSELINDLERALNGKDQYAETRSKRLSEFYAIPDGTPSEATQKQIIDIV